eukprot:TRINITY_DN8009_c0_g1_i12.p2 TRINITY_DN8009_c0_g1~~TRINITY_DN8009_c0_g1_i12.p2  ORF type:complete len:138 (-),score=25.18 TRINITY_DN8009_c0_g1_i12:49-462(-)
MCIRDRYMGIQNIKIYGNMLNYNALPSSVESSKANPEISHPVFKLTTPEGKQMEENQKLRQTAALYGSAVAMQLSIERAIGASIRRPAGVPSENHWLNIAMGSYERFEINDYLEGMGSKCWNLDTAQHRLDQVLDGE